MNIEQTWTQLGIIQRQRFEQATGVQAAPLLTDAEREAVRFCSELCRMGERSDLAATLRGLLRRHVPETYPENDEKATDSGTIRGVTEPLPVRKRA